MTVSAYAHHTEDDREPYEIFPAEMALQYYENLWLSKIESRYSTNMHYHGKVPEDELDVALKEMEILTNIRNSLQLQWCKGPASIGIAINVKGSVSFRHLESGTETVSLYQGPQIFTIGEKGTRITISKDSSMHIANIGGGTLKLKDPKSTSAASYLTSAQRSATSELFSTLMNFNGGTHLIYFILSFM